MYHHIMQVQATQARSTSLEHLTVAVLGREDLLENDACAAF